MTPINNSDTAWLIVTDFNQDNGKFYADLRESIINPEIDQWCIEWRHAEPEVGGNQMNENVGNGKCVVGDVDYGFGRGGVGEGRICQGELVGGNDYYAANQ